LDAKLNCIDHLSPLVQFLQNLQILDMGHNLIDKIPSEIGSLYYLQTLNLWVFQLQKLTVLFPNWQFFTLC